MILKGFLYTKKLLNKMIRIYKNRCMAAFILTSVHGQRRTPRTGSTSVYTTFGSLLEACVPHARSSSAIGNYGASFMPKGNKQTKHVLQMPYDPLTQCCLQIQIEHHLQTNVFCFANTKCTFQTNIQHISNTSCFRHNSGCLSSTRKCILQKTKIYKMTFGKEFLPWLCWAFSY